MASGTNYATIAQMPYFVATDKDMDTSVTVKLNDDNSYNVEITHDSLKNTNANNMTFNLHDDVRNNIKDTNTLVLRSYEEIVRAVEEFDLLLYYLTGLTTINLNDKGDLKIIHKGTSSTLDRDDVILKKDFDEIKMTVEKLKSKFNNVTYDSVTSFDLGMITAKYLTLMWVLGCDGDFNSDENGLKGVARSIEEVTASVNEFCDRVWYFRQYIMFSVLYSNHIELVTYSDTIVESIFEFIEKSLKSVEIIKHKYDIESLRIMNEFDAGTINGKLSASRWLLGYDWDYLDT